jgi:hypothetical protein
MPVVRKLPPEEVQTLENKGKGQRKLVEEQYDSFLAEYGVGDYGEAELEPSENRLTVRNRFKAAASRRGLTLDFKRTTGNVLRFKVISANDGQAHSERASGATNNGGAQAATVEPPPAAAEAPARKGRGGRPRKTA